MKTYHIFISHAWKYSEHYEKVVDWIDQAKDEGKLNWSNYSVPYHDPLIDPNTTIGKTKLKSLLDNQIKPASVIIILAGMYAAHSEWIEYEINTAVKMGKYVIGVRPWGQERIPTIISDNANIMVGWNKDSVINAILNS